MKGLLFTYALTYGGAVVSLFNPFYGLLIYFCFAIIKPESLWHWSVPVGNYSRIIGVALLLGWALNGFGNWDFRRARPIVFLLLAYFGWMILSAINAEVSPDVAWGKVESIAKIVLPFLAGVTLIDSVTKLKQVAWVIVISQGYLAYDLNRAYYDGYNRLVADGFGSMDNNSVSIGMVCVAGLAFFLGMGEKNMWRKLLCFGCAALMVHVPMFGMSRGGQLAVIITGFVSFFLIRKQPRDYAFFAVAVMMGLMLAGPQVRERFATVFVDAEERDYSANSRLELWQDCFDVMVRNPLVGVGPAHWPLIAHDYGWPRLKAAHSIWFETGADIGFPGLGFFVGFYAVTVWLQWQLLRRPELPDPVFADIARMVIAAIVGFAVSASFVSLDALEVPYYVVMLGASSLKIASFYEQAAVQSRRMSPAPLPMAEAAP